MTSFSIFSQVGINNDGSLPRAGTFLDIKPDASGDDSTVVITDRGYLGVGTSSPSAKVDIANGTVRLSSYGSGTQLGSSLYILALDADGDLVELQYPGVSDNGTSLTADFNDHPLGGITQINLNASATATLNVNNLKEGVIYSLHLYNASNTNITINSNESETNFKYVDGVNITFPCTIAVGEIFTFYYDGTYIWTTFAP